MVTYALNISNVAEVADEMQNIALYIQRLLDDLEASTARNLAEWTTPAQQAYYLAKQAWHQAASDMSAQATCAQDSLSSITNNYALAEYQGLGLWGR